MVLSFFEVYDYELFDNQSRNEKLYYFYKCIYFFIEGIHHLQLFGDNTVTYMTRIFLNKQ